MEVYKEEITVRGKSVMVDAIGVDNRIIVLTGKIITTARIKDEWYGEVVGDPVPLIRSLNESRIGADMFTFVQRLPEVKPKYNFYTEWVSVASLSIKSYEEWWGRQIRKDVRKSVRKAEKKGVIVKVVDFDDELARGITEIYNESPVRQGKPFWHYGKSFDTVKKEASTFLDKSEFIGAYYNGELIGFIKLVYLENCASTMHVISKIQHRDKAPTNALIAKTVEVCSGKQIPYLTYGEWISGTLGDFKRYNGFEKIDLPRYYIPLTLKGKMILKLNLNHGVSGMIPDRGKDLLISLRRKWYSRRQLNVKSAS